MGRVKANHEQPTVEQLEAKIAELEAELRSSESILFKRIDTLEAENECLVASCKATVNCKADAIREMADNYRDDTILKDWMLEYADNLEKGDVKL